MQRKGPQCQRAPSLGGQLCLIVGGPSPRTRRLSLHCPQTNRAALIGLGLLRRTSCLASNKHFPSLAFLFFVPFLVCDYRFAYYRRANVVGWFRWMSIVVPCEIRMGCYLYWCIRWVWSPFELSTVDLSWTRTTFVCLIQESFQGDVMDNRRKLDLLHFYIAFSKIY